MVGRISYIHMKKHFTILRIIFILLTLGALGFMAYRSYENALGSLTGGLPGGYAEAVAPIIVSADILAAKDMENMDMSIFSADIPEMLSIRLYDDKGNLELGATKNMPKFKAQSEIPNLHIAQGIIDIDKKNRDVEWLSTIYLIKKAYDGINDIVIDLENVPETGLAEMDANSKYYGIKGVMTVIDLIDALDGFTTTYENEIELFLDGISTMSDLEAISESAKNGAVITTALAVKLAEYSTVSYPVDNLPEYFSGKGNTNNSLLEKLFTKNTGSEVITPIFVYDDDAKSGLKLARYSDVIFSYKAYDVLDYIPQKELYILAGLTFLLLCFIFIPTKKRNAKERETNDQK